MRDLMTLTKALADQNRVRALMALRGSELCVCQITELFGLAPSTVSKHLSILHQAGLVESRKQGRWIYYRQVTREATDRARQAIQWLEKSLIDDPQIDEDARQLKKILQMDPVELCKRQCPK
jgi:ArsR family transcriptional regulator